MKTLKVTAHLKAGFSARFDWALSLDGIAAYNLRHEQLGSDKFIETHGVASEQTPVEDLPIAKELWGDTWWYQCSRPLFISAGTHIKHIHRRFNTQESELMVPSAKNVALTKGPYKNARIAQQVFITDRVWWFVNAVDDKELIRLIEKTTHIGAKRGAGLGSVRQWVFEEHNNANDARLLRPVPHEFALDSGITGVPLRWAIRPPARLPENQFNCIIPENVNAG